MTRPGRAHVRPELRLEQVRHRYRAIVTGGGCCGEGSECCGGGGGPSACCTGAGASLELGYSRQELKGLPEGADLGLGCGHPTALLDLRPGQIVLDLGSGAGIDCFLAARRVGPKGHVIGVDMTPEMVAKARTSARKGRYRNVEFRLGEVEHLPVADDSVDAVISNCVVNLAPDKAKVYAEAFRVLRPGGTLAVSDVVATRAIPPRARRDPSLWSSCSSGALEVRGVRSLLRRAGFMDIRVDLTGGEAPPSSLRGPASLGVVPAAILASKPRK